MRRTTLPAAVAVLALLPAAAAQAHVTLQPESAAAGSYAQESVRVPNERDDATTTKIQVKLPDGFAYVGYQAVPGWKVAMQTTKPTTPLKDDDGNTIDQQVSEVTFTATGKGIEPGAYQDFPLVMSIPDQAGQKLTFKALQTYSNGEIVRWIGAPSAEEPAPQVTLTKGDEAEGAHAGMAGTAAPASTPAVAATPARADVVTDDDDDGGGKTIAIVALIVGALGLGVGGVATLRARS